MFPLISVIVPVYNVEQFVERCVKSLIQQTYKNIEIIIVDDGATDNSGNICEALAQTDDRILVFHKANGGLSDARNYGVERSRGKYIAFIDSDDYVAPDYIAYLYGMLNRKNADIACCPLQKTTVDTAEFVRDSAMEDELVLSGKEACERLLESSLYITLVVACGKLIKSDVVKRHPFPVGKKHEDEATTGKYFYEASKVVVGNRKLYAYYQNPKSITHSIENKKNTDAIWSMQHRAEFFLSVNEKKLAKVAWHKVLNYLIRDSEKNNGRCNDEIRQLANNEAVNESIRLWAELYLNSNACYKLRKLTWSLAGKLKRKSKKIFSITKNSIAKTKNIAIANLRLKEKFGVSNNEQRIVIIATPQHGNLGDQAIVKAEYGVLRQIYPNCNIIEIPNGTYKRFAETVQKFITKDDIIVIDGGGNLGTLWPQEDDKISDIISRFKNNKIVVFPQTCYYDPLVDNTERIEKNNRIYSMATDLFIMLRDKSSYDYMVKTFSGVKVALVPDVVLSLKPEVKANKRSGALLCLRRDCEKTVDEETQKAIITKLEKREMQWKHTTTVIERNVNIANRDLELSEKWNEFAGTELVVTDRLHAMIFAVITGTKCVAIDNKSKKVGGVYAWIKHIPYVFFAENIDDVQTGIDSMLDLRTISEEYEYPMSLVESVFKG